MAKRARAKKPKEAKTEPAGDAWRWVSRQQAAELMGCSVENVDKLSANKKLEKDATGKISIASAFAWVKAQVGDKKKTQSPMEAKELFYKTKFRKAKAIVATMDMRIKRGEFISRDEVNQNYNIAFTLTKNSLMEWVTRLPEKFSGMDVRSIAVTLEDEVIKILRDMSAQLLKAKGKTSDAPTDTTKQPNVPSADK